jgi:hypothetical protein
MKLRSLTPVFTVTARALGIASLTALGMTAIFDRPSFAQSTTFFCGMSGNVPTTLARMANGETREVIRWVSYHFSDSGYDPQTRCEQVSSRFQTNYDRGYLDFITAGYLNGLPAICAGNGSSPCSSDRLLFTLKPEQDAAREIQQLFNIKTGSAGPLYESTRDSSSSSGSSVIDMKQFLESAPIVDAGDSTFPDAQQTNITPDTNQPPPQPRGGMAW